MGAAAISSAITDRVAAWVFDAALPFWATTGVDGHSFVEHLTLDAQPATVDYKRMRVQARQLYVFSHADLLGWSHGQSLAARGFAFMREHGILAEGGWVRRMGGGGGVVDPTLDLYDQAFVLFSLAWYYRASGDHQAIDLAKRTLQAVQALRADDQPGYLSSNGPDAARLQNPHMHLFEAMLALAEFTDEPEFAAEARALLDLLKTKLFDPATGTLAEYYDAAWNRHETDSGAVVEPGHHYEWVWLLRWAQRVLGSSTQDEAAALFGFSERFGLADNGLVVDEVWSTGAVKSDSSRLWPQTEALKAHIAMFESGQGSSADEIEAIVGRIFDHYLTPAPEGCWIDHFNAKGVMITDKIPTSSLYHVFLAFTELLRATGQDRSRTLASSLQGRAE